MFNEKLNKEFKFKYVNKHSLEEKILLQYLNNNYYLEIELDNNKIKEYSMLVNNYDIQTHGLNITNRLVKIFSIKFDICERVVKYWIKYFYRNINNKEMKNLWERKIDSFDDLFKVIREGIE